MDIIDLVENELQRELEEWTRMDVITPCIYRIPDILRNGNEEAYTPQVISIGPYHCTNNHLLGMQLHKMRYLKYFLRRSDNTLRDYVIRVQDFEADFRKYYNEDISLAPEELVQMILTDGIFLLEFIMRLAEPPHAGDDIFQNLSLRDSIIHDLIMLENQLPMFIVKALYNSMNDVDNSLYMRLQNLCTRYINQDSRIFQQILKNQSLVLDETKRRVRLEDTRHLLDFFMDCVVSPAVQPVVPPVVKPVKSGIRFRWGLRQRASAVLPQEENDSSEEPKLELSCSATKLQEAGIRLEPVEDNISTYIEFSDIWLTKEGTLKIPHLLVNRNTETVFRNLIAYEHCHRKSHVFRSYIVFMDCLIDTPKDVDLLVKYKIITNSLGESEHVSNLFNNLYKITKMQSQDFVYGPICEKLNHYRGDRSHRFKALCFRAKVTLRPYYKTPWKILSIIAAVILLLLTLLQTIATVKSTWY